MSVDEANYTVLHDIGALTDLRDAARQKYFAHHDPGGLTPAQKQAWEIEHDALENRLRAAQLRLDAEVEIQELLAVEWTCD